MRESVWVTGTSHSLLSPSKPSQPLVPYAYGGGGYCAIGWMNKLRLPKAPEWVNLPLWAHSQSLGSGG